MTTTVLLYGAFLTTKGTSDTFIMPHRNLCLSKIVKAPNIHSCTRFAGRVVNLEHDTRVTMRNLTYIIGGRMDKLSPFFDSRACRIRHALRALLIAALWQCYRGALVSRKPRHPISSSLSSPCYLLRGGSNLVPKAKSSDEFLTFCVEFESLPESLSVSRTYRVVAVTGCQCSGKSTLLNALFGTRCVGKSNVRAVLQP